MKQKDILLLLIPLFIVNVIWIIFSIYHNSATSTISQSLDLNIKPISPDFDTQTIESLKTREQITPLFESQKETIPTPPVNEPTKPSSASGQIEEGGNLP